MQEDHSAGWRLRRALQNSLNSTEPLVMVGAINAYCARLAEQAGHQALYLSGAGVANASYGLPDLGMTSLEDVLIDAQRITSITQLPLLVDADTGWDLAETVPRLEAAGVAGMHIEDQVELKRCGHRPNKQLVGVAEMQGRIRAACAARTDPDFFIMARTDALAPEGLLAALARAQAYAEAGADAIFAEAVEHLDDYRAFRRMLGDLPVMANITEFGTTPLFSQDELFACGVSMVLYPLSAFRAMNKAALNVYEHIRRDGHQRAVVDTMQTRRALYQTLDYDHQEALQTEIREQLAQSPGDE